MDDQINNSLKTVTQIWQTLTPKDKIVLLGAFLFLFFGLKKCYSGTNRWTYQQAYHIQVPLRYEIHGIDISRHNGDIDWQRISKNYAEDAPLRFCFIKATEAITLKDKQFENNWTGAKKIGLVRGAYHFYNPGLDPKRQAKHFITNVTLQKNDLPPVLDFETESKVLPPKKVKQNIKIWLELIENHYGKKPIIYTNQNIYKNYIKGDLENYPLWIADYGSRKTDKLPQKNLQFWQYSQEGKLRGISESVDFNVFLGGEKEFEIIFN